MNDEKKTINIDLGEEFESYSTDGKSDLERIKQAREIALLTFVDLTNELSDRGELENAKNIEEIVEVSDVNETVVVTEDDEEFRVRINDVLEFTVEFDRKVEGNKPE